MYHTRDIRMEHFTNKLLYTIPIYSEIDVLKMSQFKSVTLHPKLPYLILEYSVLDKKPYSILDAKAEIQTPGESQRLR
jgi:hypothetical protein